VKYILLISMVFWGLPALGQSFCNGSVPLTTFDARFDVDLADPSYVTDLATGLEWQRCTYGYELNDNEGDTDISNHTCDLVDQDEDGVSDNQILFRWYDAVETVSSIGDGWRLPNIKELNTIVETGCVSPAINTNIFPSAFSSAYWTNTPSSTHVSFNNGSHFAGVWVIDFSSGDDTTASKGSALLIRLVRD